MLQLARLARARDRRFLHVGLALLAGAVAIEAMTPVLFWVDLEQETWPYVPEVVYRECTSAYQHCDQYLNTQRKVRKESVRKRQTRD